MKNALFFIRLIKGTFVRLKLHRIFGVFTYILENLLYLTKFSQWKTTLSKSHFNDFFNSHPDYNNRYKLYEHIFNQENLSGEINYVEFGVAAGHSFRWWMQKNQHAGSAFFGFDTFTGLPEDWNFLFKKGSMSDKGKIPELTDSRGELIAGLFQDTLPVFLKRYCADKRSVYHLDADLYSSTLFVLTSIAPYLKNGDILLFDEFFVPTHEFRAFTDFVNSYYIKYEVIGAVNNYLQTAFRIVAEK